MNQYFAFEVTEDSLPVATLIDPKVTGTGGYLILNYPEQGRTTHVRPAVFEKHFEPSLGPMFEMETFFQKDLPVEPNPKFRQVDG